MFNSEFYVNVDAVIAASDRIAGTFTRLSNLIESNMYNTVKDILVQEFASAATIADSDDGFPVQYQTHLLSVVNEIIPTVIMDGDSLFIDLNLTDWLGDEDDLRRAFHQGAMLEDGSRLWGPYEGQALKQTDPEERHVFWEAIRYGRETVNTKKKANVPIHKLDDVHSWDETIDQYISIWGGKAPEWLFIQFGQEEWEPTVTQVDVYNNIRRAVNHFASNYLVDILAEEVRLANEYRTTGLEVGYTGPKGPARVLSGTYEVGGKVYRPGRFVPRNMPGG